MTPELKPCPFCGSENAPEKVGIIVCFVHCTKSRGGCGADGPTETSLAAAVKRWNLRAGDEK